MSTSLCCAALTAAPGARGGERRLPGRKAAAAGSAGFRGVVGLTWSSSMVPPPKPKVTVLACAKKRAVKYSWDPENEHYDGGVRQELDSGVALTFSQDFDKYYAGLTESTAGMSMSGLFLLIPLALSEEERAVQDKLKEIAERCMELQAEAMRRLRPEQRPPLYLVFRTTHQAFASVLARAIEGHANWGVSSLLIVDKLDVVRKMVSSACSAPLPLDRDEVLPLLPPHVQEAAIGGVGGNLLPQQAVAFALIEYTYNTVKSDIDKMIPASATSTTTS